MNKDIRRKLLIAGCTPILIHAAAAMQVVEVEMPQSHGKRAKKGKLKKDWNS